MKSDEAISLINQLINDAENLRLDRNTFDAWRRKCRTVLDRIFGEDSTQSADLVKVSFRFSGVYALGDNRPHIEAYNRGIDKSTEVLRTFIWEIEQFGIPATQPADDPRCAFQAVHSICLKFHAVVRQLRTRRAGRPTFDVEDEYDVQDLHEVAGLIFSDHAAAFRNAV